MMFTTEPSVRIKVTGGGHSVHSELMAFLRREHIRHTWAMTEDGSWATYFVDSGPAATVVGWLKERGLEEVG